MNTIRIINVFALLAVMLVPTISVAADDYYAQQLQYQQMLKRQNELREKMEHDRYVRQVGDKALNGFTNIVTGPLEIPKNIINQVNYNYSDGYGNSNFNNNTNPDDNIIFGIVGGIIGGLINTTGRIMTGVTDLATAPLPTKPIVHPRYVWDDFDKKNSYGQVFRLVDNPPIDPYVAPPPQPRPVALQEPAHYQGHYSPQTNQTLDTYFKQEMMK